MEDINTLGFDASFEKHIGMTKEEAYRSYTYRSYNNFMTLESSSGSLQPPEGFSQKDQLPTTLISYQLNQAGND